MAKAGLLREGTRIDGITQNNILILYLGKGGGALGVVVKGATHQNLTLFIVIFSLKK